MAKNIETEDELREELKAVIKENDPDYVDEASEADIECFIHQILPLCEAYYTKQEKYRLWFVLHLLKIGETKLARGILEEALNQGGDVNE